MSILDKDGNPVQPQLDTQQVVQLMTGLRIRIDAANAQLVQLGLLVEFLYENLESHNIKIDMEPFPEWAQTRYKEIQEQAESAMEENQSAVDEMQENIRKQAEEAGISLNDEDNTTDTASVADTTDTEQE